MSWLYFLFSMLVGNLSYSHKEWRSELLFMNTVFNQETSIRKKGKAFSTLNNFLSVWRHFWSFSQICNSLNTGPVSS